MPEIRLGIDGQSAALVHQSWNSSSFKRFSDCHFSVTANELKPKSKQRGLYVSIRKLNLRKSPRDETCIDFIQFKFSREQKKFCGRLTTAPDDLQKSFFVETGGFVKVKISLDRLYPLKYIEDTLDIEILFTAFEGEL